MTNKKERFLSVPRFISPLSDLTFKALWILGNKDIREYLNRIIYNVVGFSVRDFTLSSNELGIINYKSIANKVDTLLISPDKKIKVNIELNRFKTKTLINKNDSYLLKIGGEAYTSFEEKYGFNISVAQVNLNTFRSHYDPEYTVNEYGFYNKKTLTERMNVKIFDITLPNKKDSCYDISDEYRKDLSMFTAKSYEEMSLISEGNKERVAVMEFLKRLGSDTEFVDYYDHEEFERAERAELLSEIDKARDKGHAEGHEAGKKEERKIIIKSLIEGGMSIEKISSILKISIDDINSLLNE